jgi:transketolase
MSQGLPDPRSSVENLCVNTIRTLSIDAVQAANSGHPGAPMGLAPAAYVLWTRFLKHHPKNPQWPDRDRFVLSGGHASVLLYSLLHLTGYDLSLDDIKNFRQWESRTPGHPEYGHTPGVETTTGPLGQGFANAVGMAMTERHLAARYNQKDHAIVDHFTYVMCGDGDMMEGISSEAASLAGHLGLGKLICLYDDNRISIEGSTELAFTEDVALRFQAYHWQVIRVDDGTDTAAIAAAIETARAETEKPSLILVKTDIAYGSPNMQGKADAHGAPLGEEEIRLTKENLGWPEYAPFYVPDEARHIFGKCVERGQADEARWQAAFNDYAQAYPDLARNWQDGQDGTLTEGWDAAVPDFMDAEGPIATRAASGQVLNAIAENLPVLIGGSADLAPSNKTYLSSSSDYQKGQYDGRNIRFGVREHAMGAILSGMALHRGVRPYGGTFLVFADYMRPSIRLAALMKLPVIYVFTHDSVAVGEDGPTHQPVEHLAALRAIPGLTVIRPADALETAEAWRQALRKTDGPVALILSRQKLTVLKKNKDTIKNHFGDGAYVVADADGKPEVILIGTGSEVHIALAAKEGLESQGIAVRVVSMPSWELFEATSQNQQQGVLPSDVDLKLAVEAGVPMGWERYTGNRQAIIGITSFGASAPGGLVMEKYGFTADNIVQKALALLKASQAS